MDADGSPQNKVESASPSALPLISRGPIRHLSEVGIETIDPLSALIVLPCSKAKRLGGTTKAAVTAPMWAPELLLARENLADLIQLDDHLVTPAWQRYTGGFYKAAGTSIGLAVSSGAHIAILSGGYGVVRADEEIGWYEKALKKGEWRRGLLEESLISEAVRVGAKEVVAFAARTSDYAKIIKNTRWRKAGIQRAVLITSGRTDGGAMSKVPADLGSSFRAFWFGLSEEYPTDIWCQELT